MSNYSCLDIAISICRYVPLYELFNYRNKCNRIDIEIDKVLKPSRQKVLRGYYLMNKLNDSIDLKSDKMMSQSGNNSQATSYMKSLQDDIYSVVTNIREDIEETYKTYIDINSETDSQILSRFTGDEKVSDLIYIRNILTQIRESTSTPIYLTQLNMDEIGYNNIRIKENLSSLKRSSKNLAEVIILNDRHMFLKEVIDTAIEVQVQFEQQGLKDYIKTHTNDEVKGWLHDGVS